MEIKNKIALRILLILVLVFLIIELKGLNHIALGDEFAYYYMGKLVSNGAMPYRDFFLAHPSLEIFLYGSVFSFFGFNLMLLKLVPFLSIVLVALILFKSTKKISNVFALIAVALYLYTYTIMLEATYSYDISLSIFFMVLSFYFLIAKNKPLLSGIIYSIACLSSFHSLVFLPAFLIFIFLIKEKKKFRFLYGFLSVFITVNIVFLMVFGNNYFIDVFKYHFIKPKQAGANLEVFKNILIKNWFLAVGFVLFFISKNKKKFMLPLLLSLNYILFLLVSNRIFSYYFLILIPFIVLLSAYGFYDFTSRLKNKAKNIFLIIIFIVIIINAVLTANYLIKTNFKNLESFDELKTFITKNSNKDDELFGDLYTTPMLALYTNRQIAFNFVDTNALRFLSNLPPINEVIEKIKNEKTKFVIVRPNIGIGTSPEFYNFLTKSCKQTKYLKDKVYGDIFVYDCS